MASKKPSNSKLSNKYSGKTRRRNEEAIDDIKKDIRMDVIGGKTKRCNFKTDNDPAWYGKNPQLIKDSASLPFSQRLGALNNMSPLTPSTGTPLVRTTISENVSTFPGVMRFRWSPSFGSPGHATASDPVNTAAKNIYSFVRHANSGRTNYEATDLMMTILATSSVFSVLAMGIRAYGLIRLYDQRNMYMPDTLVKAAGFNPVQLRSDLANFRYQLNNLIAKASVLWVPSNLSIIARQYWMNTNVYLDGQSPKAQFYLYKQAYAYQYSPKTSTTGTALIPITIADDLTVGQYTTLVNSMLDALIEDEDAGIEMGDMLKAYGKENLYSMSMIDENYMTPITMSDEVMMQFHNLRTLPITPGQITQINGVISEPAFSYTPSQLVHLQQVTGELIDVKGNMTDPDHVIVATRMRPIIDGITFAPAETTFTVRCGTEIPVSIDIYRITSTGDVAMDPIQTYYPDNEGTTIRFLSHHANFDWAPLLYTTTNISGSNY